MVLPLMLSPLFMCANFTGVKSGPEGGGAAGLPD
jgi:hypothetical protein